MSIRKKTGVIIGMTIIILIVVLFGISRGVFNRGLQKIESRFLDSFQHLEAEDALENVTRVYDAFDLQRKNLLIKATDWARWDDTYRFVADGNNAYRKSNLSESTLTSLHINLLSIISAEGRSVYTLCVDGDSSYTPSVSEMVKKYGFITKVVAEKKTVSGVVGFRGKHMLIAAQPILTSEGAGPARGVFVFGRILDHSLLKLLSDVTHLKLTWHSVADTKPECHIQDRVDSISVHIVSDSSIMATMLLRRIDTAPAVCIEVSMPRTVFKHAKATLSVVRQRGGLTLSALMMAIFAAGIVLSIVIFVVLEKTVLRRLQQLAVKTDEIGSEPSRRLRLTVEGNDEITSLERAINAMLDSLQYSHERIVERDREKRMLMNNIPVGLCSLNGDNVINPEYSRQLAVLFGVEECAGTTVCELLGLNTDAGELASDVISFIDLVRKQVVPDRELVELNPISELHFTSRGIDAWYAVRFCSITHKDGRVPGVLMTVRDITEETLLARENEDMQRENIQLRHIAENPDYFREFMRETAVIISNVRGVALHLTPGTSNAGTISAMFRGVHTIKGVAGSFGLKRIETITSELEDHLSTLQALSSLSSDALDRVHVLLAALEETFTEVSRLSMSLFGGFLSEEGASVRVSVVSVNRSIEELRAIVAQMPAVNEQVALVCNEACERLRSLKTVPVGKVFSRSLRIVSRLCERFGKECTLEFSGENVQIDYEIAQQLNQVLVHLLRNAVDHGIESTETRGSEGKTVTGRISVRADKINGTAKLVVSDDGAGVDREKLCRVAVENNFASQQNVDAMSMQERVELMFLPGLTTSDGVTEVSGRGVGMDMVADTVKNILGGSIRVTSQPGAGTTFDITVPL